MRVHISAYEQRVIVEHFLEVWHQPAVVGGVTVKTAANLIVHPTIGHLVQCQRRHVQRVFTLGAIGVAEQEINTHARRKFRGVAETAFA